MTYNEKHSLTGLGLALGHPRTLLERVYLCLSVDVKLGIYF